MKGFFYFVATPIGNLGDISQRAIETLSSVDFIACEDTRHSLKLLSRYNIKKTLLSYHAHNCRETGADIVARLSSGQSGALITDAGTPGISDPGQELVRLLQQSGLGYTVIPGATAFVNALVLSGFDSSSFMFAGFIPQKSRQRRQFLQDLANCPCTLVLYSAPHDVQKDIELLLDTLGDREFAAVREISKIHEEVVFSTLSQGLAAPRGEYVLVIKSAPRERGGYEGLSIDGHITHYIESGLKPADAVKAVAKDRGIAKSTVYAEYVKLKQRDRT